MAELLLELYSEEVPPQLQIEARSQIKQFIENTFEEENVKYRELLVFSSPTRLTLFIKDLAAICNCGGISSLYNSNKSSAII